jgi:hypothetical protein
MRFNKHSILGSMLCQRELGLPSSWSYSNKHAQGVSLLLNYVSLLHCCRRQHNNVPWFTPRYIVRRQLGCILPRVPIALQCFFFSIAADSNHALPRVPPLFTVVSVNREIHVGVKAPWFIRIGCKREVRYLDCSGYSLLLLFRVGGHPTA